MFLNPCDTFLSFISDSWPPFSVCLANLPDISGAYMDPEYVTKKKKSDRNVVLDLLLHKRRFSFIDMEMNRCLITFCQAGTFLLTPGNSLRLMFHRAHTVNSKVLSQISE